MFQFFFFSFYFLSGVSQRITELFWDYILTGRLTSWHLAGNYGFMDYGLLVFAFHVLGYLFRFWWWAYEGLLATDGKAVHFIPPFSLNKATHFCSCTHIDQRSVNFITQACTT